MGELLRDGNFRLDNLRICCKRCNETKGALSDEGFSALLMLIQDWPERAVPTSEEIEDRGAVAHMMN